MKTETPLVAVIVDRKSDWETMRLCVAVLDEFAIPSEYGVMSAYRTPDLVAGFAKEAVARGIRVIIAAASGAAHLPGMIASQTILPVIGVPLESRSLKGLDSLLSMTQMPAGVPVATVAIGPVGARNAALLAAAILATNDVRIRESLEAFRQRQTEQVLASTLD